MTRVLVIGLDGASFAVLNPLMAHGIMPNIASLMERGSSHNLISTLPTNSVAAWTSFQTGKNPAGHGIFSFIDHASDNFRGRVPVNKRLVKDSYYWQIAARSGKRVAIVNTPMTYPPDETNGVVISGLMTPRSKGIFGTPASLVDEMHQAVPEYRLDVLWDTYGDDQVSLLQDLHAAVRNRTKAGLWLLSREEFDIFQIVYTVTDRLQHALWNDLQQAISSLQQTDVSLSPTSQLMIYIKR